jgi:hypothetical protein
MNDAHLNFLALLRQPPVRLTVEQTAWILNCQAHDIPVLVVAKLLKPLGNPPPNATKVFATSDVLEKSQDPVWLAKVTNAIHQHWRVKNGKKTKPQLKVVDCSLITELTQQ